MKLNLVIVQEVKIKMKKIFGDVRGSLISFDFKMALIKYNSLDFRELIVDYAHKLID